MDENFLYFFLYIVFWVCVIINILLILPIKGVLICRCVCRSWRTLISDPQFAELHFKHAQIDILMQASDPKCVSRTLHLLDFDPEKFAVSLCSRDFEGSPKLDCVKLEAKFKLPLLDAKMVLNKKIEAKIGGSNRHYIACKPRDYKLGVVNSCNGLLCLCDPKDNTPLFVCNPVTQEFVRLPEPFSFMRQRTHCLWIWLLSKKRIKEHKAIRVYEPIAQTPNRGGWMFDDTVDEIHTVGTALWRAVGKPPYFLFKAKFPTYVNGAIHWLAFDDKRTAVVLSFSFESETFQSFPSHWHPCLANMCGWVSANHIIMGEYRRCIYTYNASLDLEFWVMKEYGVAESWTNIFFIDMEGSADLPHGLCLPIKFYKTDAVLVYHSHNYLLYCKPREDYYFSFSFKIFRIHGSQYKFEAIAHIPTLLSLKDAVKNDNFDVLNVISWRILRWHVYTLSESDEDNFGEYNSY